MPYDIKIDPKLYETYAEIRLGLLRFKAEVKASDDRFWAAFQKYAEVQDIEAWTVGD